MATQKPISTISYNTEPFLREKLDEWVKAHIIQAYQYISHVGEDGDKDHIHLRIEPNKKLDPMDLTESLKEYPKDNLLPLGVRPWRPSVEEDWILYAVHDEDYMKLKYSSDKGEKLPYDWKQIKVSDGYDMEIAFIRSKAKMKHTQPNLVKRIMSGENALSLVAQGENVYTVNALMHSITGSAYTDLTNEYSRLNDEYMSVKHFLSGLGYEIEYEKGKIRMISKKSGLEIRNRSDLERSIDESKNDSTK